MFDKIKVLFPGDFKQEPEPEPSLDRTDYCYIHVVLTQKLQICHSLVSYCGQAVKHSFFCIHLHL